MADGEKQEKATPPGDFVSDDLREHTIRFLDELRKRIMREQSKLGPKLGPPKRR
ncbi:MAG: hypothetical protein ABI896_03585 [Actinomycetota bacterium]